jgi:hypothetical protein
MRPFEAMLIIANVVAFFVLVVPPLRAVRWLGTVAVIALVLAGIQIFVEGYRWPLIPA